MAAGSCRSAAKRTTTASSTHGSASTMSDTSRPDGHLCSCAVAALDRGGARALEWKLGGEKMFLEDPERHVDAN
ncbi:hypothetical protein ACP70R_005086 [Stipagrostis hirtigluma subsp. patula]